MSTTQAMIAAQPTRGARVCGLASEPHGLAIKLRLADGRIHEGALDPERHRSIHLGLLHGDSDGFVEIAAGPRPAGRQAADHDPQGRRPLPARRRERGSGVAGGAARARRPPPRRRRRGLRRAGRAPLARGRQDACRAHELAVDRRRRTRRPAGGPTAAAPQGAAHRARVCRLRRGALLLEIGRTAAGAHGSERAGRRLARLADLRGDERDDRTRARTAHLRPGL